MGGRGNTTMAAPLRKGHAANAAAGAPADAARISSRAESGHAGKITGVTQPPGRDLQLKRGGVLEGVAVRVAVDVGAAESEGRAVADADGVEDSDGQSVRVGNVGDGSLLDVAPKDGERVGDAELEVEVEGERERRGQAEEDALRATDWEGSALRDTRKEEERQPEIEGEPLEDAVPALEAEGEPVVEGEAHTVTLAVGEAPPDAVRAGLAVPLLVGSALLVIDTEPHGELLGVGEGRIVDDKVFAGDTLRSGVRDGHAL
jgi:hypothetical protein